MKCYKCPYTEKIQRKFGVTTHCNLEPTHMDVSYHVDKKSNNLLCPFICNGSRFEGVDYSKYINNEIAAWIDDYLSR